MECKNGVKLTYHLAGNVADGLQVELAATLLEEVFEGLAEQVHNHDVEHLAVVGLLVTDKVQEGHVSFAAHFVNKLGLPKQHDVTLHLNGFFLSNRTTQRSHTSALHSRGARTS